MGTSFSCWVLFVYLVGFRLCFYPLFLSLSPCSPRFMNFALRISPFSSPESSLLLTALLACSSLTSRISISPSLPISPLLSSYLLAISANHYFIIVHIVHIVKYFWEYVQNVMKFFHELKFPLHYWRPQFWWAREINVHCACGVDSCQSSFRPFPKTRDYEISNIP